MHRRSNFVMLERFAKLLVFVAFAALVPAAVFRALEAPEIREVEVGLDLVETLDARLATLDAADRREKSWQVGHLGDSMVISYPPPRQVPTRLQEAVDQLVPDPGSIRVHSLASPGMGPFDFYFLADRVADARPDQVILPINLTVLCEAWRNAFSRPRLAGLLPPSRIPEAFSLPLERIGVTADRLLGYIAVVQSGSLASWHDLTAQQAKVGVARSWLAGSLSGGLGSEAEQRFARDVYAYRDTRQANSAGFARLTPEGVEERFGPALGGVDPSNPSLEVLAASIRSFRQHGIEVLVYTSPLNVEHIEAIGSANPEGLARTLASIESVSRHAGARFIDLHDLLPDAGFRDFAGHLRTSNAIDGPKRLADRLAPIVVEAAQHARAGRD
ncbi:MAG: hypothetical protein VX466_06485 [Myxococcota bacterium]|nr:hypothetical protein [Myxococcota bacterium]